MTDVATIVLVLRLENVRDWLATHGSRVLFILIVAILVRLLVHHGVPPAMRRALALGSAEEDPVEVQKRADTLIQVLVRLADAAILILLGFILLSEVGYNLVPVVTGLGIGGVAIGLGAQSLVKDTINGLFILAENQFRRGDFVTVAGVSGTVLDINLRRTVLRDVDGTVHSIPNSAITVSSNHTRDYSGISVTVLISHNANLEQAIALAAQVGVELQQEPAFADDVLEPPHPLRIESVDEKGVTLRILGKAKAGSAAALSFEYRRRLKTAFDAAGLRYTVATPPLGQGAAVPAQPAPSGGTSPSSRSTGS